MSKDEGHKDKNTEDQKPNKETKEDAALESEKKPKPKEKIEKQAEAEHLPESKPEKKSLKEEKKEEAKAEASPSSPLKKMKINRMTLADIEAKLKEIQETMGGFDSKYAQQLLRRKKHISI